MCRCMAKAKELGIPEPKNPFDFMILYAGRLPGKHPFKGIIDQNFEIPVRFDFYNFLDMLRF